MLPPTSQPGSARSAAALNALIRALLLRTGGWLYGETRAEYQTLVEEWTVAVAAERDDVVKAA